MPRYIFSLGNSNTGPVGFCAAVHAASQEEALTTLRKALPAELEQRLDDDARENGIEYIEVYFNGDVITTNDIVDEDE